MPINNETNLDLTAMRPSDATDALIGTIIYHIAALLMRGAGGDWQVAMDAATASIRAHKPRTEAQLQIVARILSFNLQAGEALAQAADPEMPLIRVLRLRSGAVSLAREAYKAEQQLAKLQQNNQHSGEPVVEPQLEPASPQAEKATALIDDNRKIAAYAKTHGLTFTKALQQRERDRRLAERQRKEQERQQQGCPNPVPA